MRIRYQAVGSDGKKTNGEIEADDERQALDRLVEQGLTPITLNAGAAKPPWWQRELSFGAGRINRTALHSFLFHLSCLLEARIPLMEALTLLIAKTEDKRLRGTLSATSNGVANGKTLSSALRDADPSFSPQVLAALEVGENANNLAHAAGKTAHSLEAQLKFRSTLVGAATYPIILLVMSSVVLGVVLFYLLPILEPVFASTALPGAPNPLAPLVLFRDVVTVLAQIVGSALLVLLFSYPLWRKASIVSNSLDRLPILGALRRDARSQFTAETLSNILASGGDINIALSVAATTAHGETLKRELRATQARVLDGDGLALALEQAPSLDPIVRQLATLGERSEQLPALMQVAADLLESTMKKRIDRMMALLVPVLTALVGLIVGTMVLITMNAVLSVNDLVQ